MKRTGWGLFFFFILVLNNPLNALDYQSPIKDICHASAEQAFRGESQKWGDYDWDGEPEPLAQKLFDAGLWSQMVSPWYLNFSPYPSHRRAALILQMKIADGVAKAAGIASLDSLWSEVAQGPFTYSEDSRVFHRENMKRIRAIALDPQITQAKERLPAFCALYPFLECRRSLLRQLELMETRVVNGASFSLPSVADEIFGDPVYARGLVLTARRLQKRIAQNSQEGDVFSDLESSFREAGDPPARATERAMKVLGFYGTRGASMGLLAELNHPQSQPVFSALLYLSSAMSLLDLRTAGNSYSHPRGFHSDCVYGRPYHFWMAAYLSWQLRRESFSRRAAYLSSHITGMAYEVAGAVWGKDQSQIYLGPFFNFYSVNVKENVTFNDAGARFGTLLTGGEKRASRPTINLDGWLGEIFADGEAMPSLSAGEIKEGLGNPVLTLTWFRRVIAPDTHLAERVSALKF